MRENHYWKRVFLYGWNFYPTQRMTENAIISNGTFQPFNLKKIVGLFISPNRHWATKKPDGKQNMKSNKNKKEDVAFFHLHELWE